jgi:hypothetical protein
MVLLWWPDTPDLQRLYDNHRAAAERVSAAAGPSCAGP